MQGVWDGDPASIGKWSEDQSWSGSHIFITIIQGCIDLLNSTVINFLIPIVSQHLDPLEIIDWLNIVGLQLFNNISCMHICSDQCNYNSSLKICELSSDEACRLAQCLYIYLIPLSQCKWIWCLIIQVIFSCWAPHDLSHRCHNLTIMSEDELISFLIGVIYFGLLDKMVKSFSHLVLKLI